MRIFDKKILVTLIFLLVVASATGVFLIPNIFKNGSIELEEVVLKNDRVDSNMFAIMLDQGDGNYTESKSNKWPNIDYEFNSELSGCIDNNGNTLNGILTYDEVSNQVKIKTAKATYCYLYFDYSAVEDVTFAYTGGPQEYEVPVSGYYYIETFGASGAAVESYFGGKGGYSSGYIHLNKGEKIYIYVGGAASDLTGGYNGGGSSSSTSSEKYGVGGGGATDIRYFGEYEPTEEDLVWNSPIGLENRIMVAGGGGGANKRAENYGEGSGGHGGTLIGGAGTSVNNSKAYGYHTGLGGTQTVGGYQHWTEKGSGKRDTGFYPSGVFGYSVEGQSGGGGGYYGGASGDHGGMGGGSSFISGYAGVNARKSPSTGIRYIKDCTNGNSKNTSNHWVELQAFSGGTNVALNKTVTSPTNANASNLAYVTNGATASGAFANLSTGEQCIIVDLEQTYTLDKITVWHYYSDGRSYNNHSTYVSSDNESWTTLIDDQSGVKETSSGISVELESHTNNTLHYSEKYFINGNMGAGINDGDGSAKLSYVGKTTKRADDTLDGVRYIKDCINGNSIDSTNKWIEFQAIQNGENVAYGASVSSTATPLSTDTSHLPLTALVDSNIDTRTYLETELEAASYIELPAGEQCVMIDLEDYYDLDEVAVWHYYNDEISYNNHSMYVSSDNETWTTLIDNESEVKETSKGIRYQTNYTSNVANKFEGKITLSETTGVLTYPNTGSFTITENLSGGTLSITSSDTSIATASLASDGTVTITPTEASGKAVITVTSAETDLYTKATAKYEVYVNLSSITGSKQCPFYNGTYAEADDWIYVCYEMTYDYSTNTTAIKLWTNSLRIHSAGYAQIKFTTTLTATATDSGNSAVSTITYNPTYNHDYAGYGRYYYDATYEESPFSPKLITVQHTDEPGTKYVSIHVNAKAVSTYTATYNKTWDPIAVGVK